MEVKAALMPTPDGFQYVRSRTAEEAVAQLAADARVIAGGTVLALEVAPEDLKERFVDISGIAPLGELRVDAQGASIGIAPGRLLVPGTGNQVGPIHYMYASHGVDLAVNQETGEVNILRYVACQDVGKALNPAAIRGQILGSIAMGPMVS